ncbi:5-formyltetrahydrofolate cyclo-ligase [Candidatus Omnitrophota bacterium]
MLTTRVRKEKIRKEIKEQLNKQSDAQRLRKSNRIKQKLFQLAEFKRADHVMFYLATAEEVQTRAMIKAAQGLGKKILVPKVLRKEKRMIATLVADFEKELTTGPFGIEQAKDQYTREIPGTSIDLVVVPGLAFDQQGRRLGRGGGYYDKFLSGLSEDTPRVGLAFDFQVLKNLPTLPHDTLLTKVISA